MGTDTTNRGTQKYTNSQLDDKEFAKNSDKMDSKFGGGPVERHCTDCFCCVIFACFLVGMVIVTIMGYESGDPVRLLAPYDSSGNPCGFEGRADYPYLFFVKLTGTTDIFSETTCVKDCPKEGETPSCILNEQVLLCPESTYNTDDYLGRYCLPSFSEDEEESEESEEITEAEYEDNEEVVLSEVAKDKFGEYMSDVYTSYEVIIICAFLAFVLLILYMFLLRYFAGIIAWASIILVLILFVMLGYFFYDRSADYKDPDDERNCKILAYVFWALTVIYLLMILCMWKRIQLAIAILKTAATFVKSTIRVLFLPPVFFAIILLFLAYWISAALYIWSSGEITHNEGTSFAEVEWNDSIRYCWYYHLFALFWVLCFLLAMLDFILAVAVSTWYFTSHGDSGTGEVCKGVWWAIRYHMGSLAFGSLILAIVYFLRAIFEYMRKKLQNTGLVGDNCCGKCALRVVSCCLCCCNRFVKFLTSNAYIQIAITSESFCQAAKVGFFLIMRNCLRYMAVTNIGGAFIFLGKFLIAGLTAFFAYLIMTNWDKVNDKLYSPILPTVLCFILAYIIAAIFLSLYGFAANTILQCFLIEEETSDSIKRGGIGEHTPKELKKFLPKIKKEDDNRA